MKIDCKSDFAFHSADFCSLWEASELGVRSFVCGTESLECPLCHHILGTCASPSSGAAAQRDWEILSLSCCVWPSPATSQQFLLQRIISLTLLSPISWRELHFWGSSTEQLNRAQQLRLNRAQLGYRTFVRLYTSGDAPKFLPGHSSPLSAHVCPRQDPLVCCTSPARSHRGILESWEQGKVSLQSILWQQMSKVSKVPFLPCQMDLGGVSIPFSQPQIFLPWAAPSVSTRVSGGGLMQPLLTCSKPTLLPQPVLATRIIKYNMKWRVSLQEQLKEEIRRSRSLAQLSSKRKNTFTTKVKLPFMWQTKKLNLFLSILWSFPTNSHHPCSAISKCRNPIHYRKYQAGVPSRVCKATFSSHGSRVLISLYC